VVICIAGFPSGFSDADIEGLARKLRSRCGCGGTVSGRVVEVQGDQAERVRAFLESEGFQVAGIK
jgi:translation initiation factor 1